ncbi:hypothetical protein HanPI659440_Chr09g0335461 [Helianthus annuus]|nr:hypothetical protein HanPI659440_Chr09g0335461 [Helianthus annuus]
MHRTRERKKVVVQWWSDGGLRRPVVAGVAGFNPKLFLDDTNEMFVCAKIRNLIVLHGWSNGVLFAIRYRKNVCDEKMNKTT